MSGFETSPLCCWCYFFCRSIRSTVSVCVTPTAAVAPPPPAPTAPSRTRACVPTTATTAAAKLATQRPTDRCGRDGPTHTQTMAHTQSGTHTMCSCTCFVHLNASIRPQLSFENCLFLWANENWICPCGKTISLVFSGNQLVSVEWNEKSIPLNQTTLLVQSDVF